MELNSPNYREDPAYKHAVRKVKALKGFYTHLAVYLAVNILLFYVYTQDEGFIEGLKHPANYSTAFFWGIGLAAHAAGVFLPNMIFGRKWEERKIKELMDKDKKSSWE